MAVDGVSGTSNGSTTRTGYSSLTSEDFTKIIFAELGRQDPLSPQDTSKLLDQIATIRNIQSNTDLTTDLKSIVKETQFASAASTIGSMISGLTSDYERVEGTVISVGRGSDGVAVNVSTKKGIKQVPFSNITEFLDPSKLPKTN
ncbi:MAG: flagellar hook capping FlgD N-terminal domain-containing protein [Planctomycetota bacterium]|nr:flagellar hook capping FlgD N-terminal domain-containing protein [Planctomycetota bacterium]